MNRNATDRNGQIKISNATAAAFNRSVNLNGKYKIFNLNQQLVMKSIDCTRCYLTHSNHILDFNNVAG